MSDPDKWLDSLREEYIVEPTTIPSDKESLDHQVFDRLCRGLGLPDEVIDLLKPEPGTEIDFGKPTGWYDSCFPTKDLHDKWMEGLREPFPEPEISDDLEGFRDNPVMSHYKQWRDTLENGESIPASFPVWVKFKLPSKQQGRKGTRKGWKRLNPPRWMDIDLESIHQQLLPQEKKDEPT